MKKKLTILSIAALAFAINVSAENYPFQDQKLDPMERAADLVSRLTIEEKASQMVNQAAAIDRLGVPSYMWWNECLHGVARSGKSTIFPQSIGLAATFDEDLVARMTSAIGDEARALQLMAKRYGNDGKYTGLTFYSPNVNIYRDPRWGRGQETLGEDPTLTSRMGCAFVEGLQGSDDKYLKAAACAKHFAVHSGPEALRAEYNAFVSWEDLYETYFPAFKSLVQDAHVESVMSAYNRINGTVCSGNPNLIDKLLRKQWGFDGYITSDCNALGIFPKHGVTTNPVESAAIAANAGLNLECGGIYRKNLPKAIKEGRVDEKLVDSLLTRLMATRFKLGYFDDEKKVPYNHVSDNVMDSKLHKDIAYESAVKSMVLLENKDNLLPLTDDVKYLYVTGPMASLNDAVIGNYYGASGQISTFYEGLTEGMPKGMSIQYRQGVMVDRYGYNDWTVNEAPEGDVIIACMGLTNMLEGEKTDAIASQHHGDMMDLSLPEAQLKYLRKLRENLDKHNKKLIVVISSGTPLIMTELKEIADALIYAWYPGEAGGIALADLIFGKVSPSARTPITFVKSLEQLPPYDSYDMTGRTYRYMSEEPLYPFGYGLSYTTFDYSDVEVAKSVKAGEEITVKVQVENTGEMTADEVVQLYVSTSAKGIKTPIRRLADFARVTLRPNEEKVVELTIKPEMVSILNNKHQRIVESGEVQISVGGGQPVPSTKSYVETSTVIKGSKVIEDLPIFSEYCEAEPKLSNTDK